MSRKSKKHQRGKSPAARLVTSPITSAPPAANPPSAWSAREWLIALLLLAGVALVYQPAWRAGFIWDDDIYVTSNPLLTAPDGLWRIWFSYDSPSQYFPLVYTTMRFEHALWGLAPIGYHCLNILYHGLNTILLWRLLLRLRIPGALLAAALFALHPVQVESVAWVTELKNVQMGFFFLLSLLAWTRFTGPGAQNRAWPFYALSLLFYALALFSKTTACTLPAALLLIAWLRGEPIRWRRLIEILPFLLLGIGMGLLTIFWERYHQGTQGKLFTIGPLDRLLVAARAFWFYLGKLLWPATLSFSYPRWSLSPPGPALYISLLALCALGGAALHPRRFIGRGATVALAFFAATLSPILGFIMLYTFRYSFVADHYQYLACIGPIALLSAGVERLRPRHPVLVPALSAALLSLLALLSSRQSATYRDIETLWRATIAGNPGSWLAHNNLGNELLQQGRADEAIAQLREAIRIEPTFPEGHYSLGNALLKQAQVQPATAEFREALRVDPTYIEGHNGLGNALLQQGRVADAIVEFREAIRLNPALSDAHNNLGAALLRLGQLAGAIAEFREAIRLNPSYQDALVNLGLALSHGGRIDDAAAEYRAALAINPANADACYNLANALVQQGRTADAIAEYRAALAINPSYADAHSNLGNIFLLAGQTEQAAAEYHAALAIDPASSNAHNNLGTALLRQGKLAGAIAEYRAALRINPAYANAHSNLANALLHAGQPAEAITHLRQAIALRPSSPALLRALAAACAQAGQFPDAIRTAQEALQLAVDQPDTPLADALRHEITLYQSGRQAPQ